MDLSGISDQATPAFTGLLAMVVATGSQLNTLEEIRDNVVVSQKRV